jgi:putative ABC transport system permease protein
MRTRDVFRSAVGGLWRQKGRSTLTLLGVAVGACALAFSLSLGIGLRALIDNEFRSRDEFWWVTVFPANRGMKVVAEKDIPPAEIAVDESVPTERRERLRQRRIAQYRQRYRPGELALLTKEKLAPLAVLPDVAEVRTFRNGYGQLWVGERHTGGALFGGRLDYFDPPLDTRLLHGRLPNPDSPTEAAVSEMLLYEVGLRTDAELAAAVGKTVRVVVGRSEFERAGSLASLLSSGGDVQEAVTKSQMETLNKIVAQLPGKIDTFDLNPLEKAMVKAVMARPVKADEKKPVRHTAEFTVVGVLRELLPAERDADPFRLPHRLQGDGTDLFATVSGGERSVGWSAETVGIGYERAFVRVTPGGDLQAVVDGVTAAGLDQFSMLKAYRNVKREVTLIAAGLNLFSLISLLVAAIGITNTLFTSVLERTKEIGIWKSLGARDGTILLLFLTEGAVIGLAGGLVGLAAAWGLSIPGDGLVRRMIESQSNDKLVTDTVFEFPLWLSGGAVLFAVVVTTLAALYPARRASRVQPVEALRHE